jgi:protein-S-isoprenylcysteine O-methyltransferase Ste14
MERFGHFLFRYRNGLFPAAYLLLFLNSPPILKDRLLSLALGFTLALAGQLIRAMTIGLAYIIRGGKRRQIYAEDLVKDGIFAHCRNPLYVGNFLILCGLGFAANSLWFFGIAIPFFALAYRSIIAAEESYLWQKFGAEYDEYCQRVNRFVPKLAGLGATINGMEFKWRRLIVKEYGSTYAWMSGMILVILKNQWFGNAEPCSAVVVWTLASLLILLSAAYLCARHLKKSRILQAD